MKKQLLLLLSSCLISLTAFASPFTYKTRQDYYVQLSGAFNIVSDPGLSTSGGVISADNLESDDGFGIHGAIGRNFDPLRLELEYSFKSNDADVQDGSMNVAQADITYNSVMINLLYEGDLGRDFYVFAGGGLGAARVNMDVSGFGDDSDTTFAWQAMFGVGYNFTREMSMFVGYRYFSLLESNFEIDSTDIDMDPPALHGIELGLRFGF